MSVCVFVEISADSGRARTDRRALPRPSRVVPPAWLTYWRNAVVGGDVETAAVAVAAGVAVANGYEDANVVVVVASASVYAVAVVLYDGGGHSDLVGVVRLQLLNKRPLQRLSLLRGLLQQLPMRLRLLPLNPLNLYRRRPLLTRLLLANAQIDSLDC